MSLNFGIELGGEEGERALRSEELLRGVVGLFGPLQRMLVVVAVLLICSFTSHPSTLKHRLPQR